MARIRHLVFPVLLAGLATGVVHLARPTPTSSTASPAAQVSAAPENAPNAELVEPEPISAETHTRLKAARRALRSRLTDQPPHQATGEIFNLTESGTGYTAYAVALDQLYFPSRPPSERLQRLPVASDLSAHLARAAGLIPAGKESSPTEDLRRSAAPRLVLYPVDGPRNVHTRRIVTPGLAVSLRSASAPTPTPVPALGIVRWERPAYAPSEAIARIAGDPAQALRAAAALALHPEFTAVRPLLGREHAPAAVPRADLFPKQWHLRNTGQNSATKGIDVGAVPAWDLATGIGVTIGIVDGAFDRYHPAYYQSLNTQLCRDWVNDGDSPWTNDAESDQNHATAVAGLALAPGLVPNSTQYNPQARVAGLAPSARLAVLRVLGGPTTEEDDAEAVVWNSDKIAVKNNSWAPFPLPYILTDLPPLFRAALDSATTEGRSGLGTILVWGAGNGRKENVQGSKNAYAANRRVIAVAAVNSTGAPADFSDDGPHVLVSAPGAGKGKSTVALTTTDRVGTKGYNGKYAYRTEYPDQDYTNSFTGTSAAAPLVSGAAALLLELRPDLGWRDVQEILLRSANELRPKDAAWARRPLDVAGFRLKHHPRLGGGLLNAHAALQLAQNWIPLPPEQAVEGTLENLHYWGLTLPDGETSAQDYNFALNSPSPLRVERVELLLDIDHPYRGDLTIQLVSPSGVVSEFAARSYYDDSADYPGYTFSSVRHWGESSVGTPARPGEPAPRWRLRIKDDIRGDQGTLRAASLRLHGTPITAPTLVNQPSDLSVGPDSSLVLSFGATGSNLVYAWYRNGKLVRQTLGPIYAVAKPTKADFGTYYCVVKNAAGSFTTRTVNVTSTTNPAPVVITVRYGDRVDSTLSNPFPFPVTWSSAYLPGGLSLDSTSGRLDGVSYFTNPVTAEITARCGDRTVRYKVLFQPVTTNP